MKYKKLYIFVEGNDDELFFRYVVIPALLKKYSDVEIIQYAQLKRDRIDMYLLSIKTLNMEYIFTADKDDQPSMGQKIKAIKDKYDYIDHSRISIVITEIESWYLAGVSEDSARILKISAPVDTDELTKEEFNDICRRSIHSRIDFQLELLKNFSMESARQRNQSLNFFYEKYME